MQYDIFFSISQTPVDGIQPDEATMFRNFFDQVEAADELGFGVAWIAESHLSSEVQKTTSHPVVPHWKGEIGLNVDFLQTATRIFQRTKRIEAGSAIMNILCNGGPVAAAERVHAFLGYHGLDPAEQRRIHVGFAGGRFDFMNRAYGVRPRNALEEVAWRALKGQVFKRAAQIFVRLLNGETLASNSIPPLTLRREHFRSDEDWDKVLAHLPEGANSVDIPPFFDFENLKLVPAEVRRELLQLVIGSHDPSTQEIVNTLAPVHVFNLSITRPEVIEDTHRRLSQAFHHDGGPWHRSYMPRTAFVFINGEAGLTPTEQREAAHREARAALGAYWTALQGTLDPAKVERAADNALIGNPQDIAEQLRERFHPDERLMLWFDFFNHNNDRVIRNMRAFMEQVRPLVEG